MLPRSAICPPRFHNPRHQPVYVDVQVQFLDDQIHSVVRGLQTAELLWRGILQRCDEAGRGAEDASVCQLQHHRAVLAVEPGLLRLVLPDMATPLSTGAVESSRLSPWSGRVHDRSMIRSHRSGERRGGGGGDMGLTLLRSPGDAHADHMFVVDEPTAEAIRRAWEEGELSGIVEFKRHFPLISDHARARECARMIAAWKPGPLPVPKRRKMPRPSRQPRYR